jgi:hypothetical protein
MRDLREKGYSFTEGALRYDALHFCFSCLLPAQYLVVHCLSLAVLHSPLWSTLHLFSLLFHHSSTISNQHFFYINTLFPHIDPIHYHACQACCWKARPWLGRFLS